MHSADDESTSGMIQNVDIPLDVPTLWTPAHVARAQLRIQTLQDEKQRLHEQLDGKKRTGMISKAVIVCRSINHSNFRMPVVKESQKQVITLFVSVLVVLLLIGLAIY